MRTILARGLVGSCLTLIGGWAYVKLPEGTWVNQIQWLMRWHALPNHLGIGLGISFVGLAVMTWAWWDLVRLARSEPLLAQRRTRLASGVWAAPLLLAPPLFSGDGWSYVATGYLAGHGLNPYLWTPSALPLTLASGVNPHWMHTPSPYGPLALWWGAGISHLTADPWLLLAGYRLLALLGLALMAWAIPRLARRAGRDPGTASAVVLASPFVLGHGIGGLHNDLAVAGLMLAALALTARHRWIWGAVLAGVAAAIKVPGGLVVVGVILLSLPVLPGWWLRVRRTGQVGVVSVLTLLASGWVSNLGLGWIDALSVADHQQSRLSVPLDIGHWARLAMFSLGPAGHVLVHQWHPLKLAHTLGLLAVVTIAAWVLLRSRARSDAAVLGGTGLVLLIATLFNPAVHYWYALWCLPLLACVRFGRRTTAAVIAAIAVLGLTAMADESLHVVWMNDLALAAIGLGPIAGWLLGKRLVPPAS